MFFRRTGIAILILLMFVPRSDETRFGSYVDRDQIHSVVERSIPMHAGSEQKPKPSSGGRSVARKPSGIGGVSAPAPVFDRVILGVPVFRTPQGSAIVGDFELVGSLGGQQYVFDRCAAGPFWAACEPQTGAPVRAAVSQEELSTAVESAVLRMQVSPSPVFWQPQSDEVLVNIETIFYSSAKSQRVAEDLLGFAVEIEVTPEKFVWDFGDGNSLETTEPGQKFPYQTVTNVYEEVGNYEVSLETTWSARYRVNGEAQWREVSGKPLTHSEGGSLTAVARQATLELPQ